MFGERRSQKIRYCFGHSICLKLEAVFDMFYSVFFGEEELVSTYSRGYIEATVSNPITHHTWEQGKFTTYLVCLETNNRAFSVMKSMVRRRYSEFYWLRDVLAEHFADIKTPQLPPKKYFGGQFNPEVIEQRTVGLSEFLQKVVDEPVYLSENALHLFLQTQLSIKAIEDCIQGKTERNVVETIQDQVQRKETLSLPLDSEYLSQQDASVNSSFASSPHDIFSPTRPMSMEFHSSSESGSVCSDNSSRLLSSKTQEGATGGHLLPPCSSCGDSDNQNNECPGGLEESGQSEDSGQGSSKQSTQGEGRFLRVRSMPQIVGASAQSGSPPSSASGIVASHSFTGRSSLRTVSSSSDLSSSDPRRPKRHVTFSPEVTVAEIIDRFSKSPKTVKREDMPSVIIAQTMAY